MSLNVDAVMTPDVQVARLDDLVGEVRERMVADGIGALPVVDGEGALVGIVTATDLVEEHPALLAVSEVMSDRVLTVPRYDGVHIAARVMRNHRVHHVVVTEGHDIAGMVSSFDLLRLVEEHRFVMKNPPTESVRKGSARA